MYLGGVAVECLFRAFILRETKVLETGHDILLLFRASRLKERLLASLETADPTKPALLRRLRHLESDIAEISLRWANDYRYASEARLRAHLRRRKLNLGIKGDFLKENSRLLVEASRRVIEEGERSWNRPV